MTLRDDSSNNNPYSQIELSDVALQDGHHGENKDHAGVVQQRVDVQALLKHMKEADAPVRESKKEKIRLRFLGVIALILGTVVLCGVVWLVSDCDTYEYQSKRQNSTAPKEKPFDPKAIKGYIFLVMIGIVALGSQAFVVESILGARKTEPLFSLYKETGVEIVGKKAFQEITWLRDSRTGQRRFKECKAKVVYSFGNSMPYYYCKTIKIPLVQVMKSHVPLVLLPNMPTSATPKRVVELGYFSKSFAVRFCCVFVMALAPLFWWGMFSYAYSTLPRDNKWTGGHCLLALLGISIAFAVTAGYYETSKSIFELRYGDARELPRSLVPPGYLDDCEERNTEDSDLGVPLEGLGTMA